MAGCFEGWGNDIFRLPNISTDLFRKACTKTNHNKTLTAQWHGQRFVVIGRRVRSGIFTV